MEMTNNHDHSGMYETTFGVDGEIETYTNEKPVSKYKLKIDSDLPVQGAFKKVVCDSLGLADFAVELMDSVFKVSIWPTGLFAVLVSL